MAPKNVPEQTGLILPDEDSFVTPVPTDATTSPIGRVAGLDYAKWASAIVDLDAPETRIAGERARLTAKGYKKVESEVVVGGFPHAEAWVVPRRMYEQNRQRRAERIDAMVDSGQMTEFANRPNVVTKGRSK